MQLQNANKLPDGDTDIGWAIRHLNPHNPQSDMGILWNKIQQYIKAIDEGDLRQETLDKLNSLRDAYNKRVMSS